jgi:hypothetical protein
MSAELEKRVIRKISFRIVLCCYILSRSSTV